MKKYMVRCDMGGVSGVVNLMQIIPGQHGYGYGCRMMTADLLALLKGLKSGGADEIVVYDLHCDGLNLDIEKLPEFAKIVCGKPPYTADWAGGLEDTFEGVILLGFPPKCGTDEGVLSYTYDKEIRDMRLNGVSVGEIGMEAAIAGDFDIPVLLVTSDSSGIIEATSLLPGVLGVAVKDAIGDGGMCYPLSTTTNLIRLAAEQIVNDPPDVEPYLVDSEVLLQIDLAEGSFLESARRVIGESEFQDSTLELRGKSALETWAAYLLHRDRIYREIVT